MPGHLYLESQRKLLINYQAEIARQADLIKQLRQSNLTARSKNVELLELLKKQHVSVQTIMNEKASIQVMFNLAITVIA